MKNGSRNKYFSGFMGLLCTGIFCLTPAIGQEYPAKPIDFIIGLGAGGSVDVSGRTLANQATKYIGQPFNPINKPGAVGAIATAYIKNAKPDGYTIGVMSSSPPFFLPFIQDVPYDVLNDFTYIMNYGELLFFLAERSDRPWKSWKEVIDFARKHPGQVKVGMAATRLGNVTGVALSRIMLMEGIKFTFIPLKSSAEVLTATLGGHVDVFGSTVDPTVKDYIATGKLRILALVTERKISGFENIPTLREIHGFGLPHDLGIVGIAGPKGLPPNIVKKLEDAFLKSTKEPGFVKVMAGMDTAIVPMNSQQFTEHIHKTHKEMKEIIEKLKIQEDKK